MGGWTDLPCDGIPTMNKGEKSAYNPNLFCDDCVSLYMTEERQKRDELKENHLCCNYRVRLDHGEFYPHIKRPKYCIEKKVLK